MRFEANVNDYNLPVMEIDLAGFSVPITALIDTAFEGHICITDADVARSRDTSLRWAGLTTYLMADGITKMECAQYLAQVQHSGQIHETLVNIPLVRPKLSSTSRQRVTNKSGVALVGAQFLSQFVLNIDYPQKAGELTLGLYPR